MSWFRGASPDAAIEMASDAVSAAVVGGRGRDVLVQSWASEPLPAGALTPSLTAQNVSDRRAVQAALRTVIERLGTHPKRVALVVPDLSTRVSLVRFEQVPPGRDDLEQLIRWQLKKSTPFPAEDACISWVPGMTAADGSREFVVVQARRDAVREYEGICEELGMHPGLVDLSTFGVINCFLAGGNLPSGDWLLVHMRSDYTSIAIMRGADMVFFRNRAEGDGDTLADLVHQTTMYYQDRLSGQGFSRVLLGGVGRAGGDVEGARRGLEERLGIPVEPIDPTRVAMLTSRISATNDIMARLAPLVGMLLRSRDAVVAA